MVLEYPPDDGRPVRARTGGQVSRARLDLREEYRIFLHELEAIKIALQSRDLQAVADLQRAHISMSFNRLMLQKD